MHSGDGELGCVQFEGFFKQIKEAIFDAEMSYHTTQHDSNS